MCSIIGYRGKNSAAPILVNGLQRMEYRGYDSVGIATKSKNQILLRKGIGKVVEVNNAVQLDELPGNIGIGHTRWATHGKVTEKNAHPHPSNSGKIAIVHNGIIENFEELKSNLQKKGFDFHSETDTEVIANLIQLNFDESPDIKQAIIKTVAQLKGHYSFVVIFEDGTIVGARFHEPLIVGVGKNSYYLSSDVLGFIEKTDDAVYLDNENFVILNDAGSKISPKLPYFQTGIAHGKNIAIEPGLEQSNVMHAIDCGRILGRTLASCTDCLIIGESIPAGTTTALAVLKSLGVDAHVSSSMPKNPKSLKNGVVEKALERSDSKEPYDVIANVGDPMIPFVAGMISTASEITNVILAGGTQMAAVLALAKSTGYDENRVAIGTTSYIIADKDANLLDMVKSISDIPVLSINPRLKDSKFDGLRAYSKGFVKEGVGAGGSMIASILKTGIDSKKLLELIDKEYSRVTTSQ